MIWDLALATFIALVFLAVLGMMREVGILRGEVQALVNLVTVPQAPSYAGRQLPPTIVDAVRSAYSHPPGHLVVAFLDASCGSCQELLRALGKAQLPRNQVFFVLAQDDYQENSAGHNSDAQFLQRVRRVSDKYVLDGDGRLAETAEAQAFPLLLLVDTSSMVVIDFSVRGDERWIKSALLGSGVH